MKERRRKPTRYFVNEEGEDSGKLKRQNHKAAEFAANLLVTLTEGGSCIPELH